jgi:hypothetical protein
MRVLRSKSVGTKVTDDEYFRLECCAGEQRIGEWVREVLLSEVTQRPVEQILLSEVLALRTILLNLHFAIANGEAPTVDGMRELIDRADQDKISKAQERLRPRASPCISKGHQ